MRMRASEVTVKQLGPGWSRLIQDALIFDLKLVYGAYQKTPVIFNEYGHSPALKDISRVVP